MQRELKRNTQILVDSPISNVDISYAGWKGQRNIAAPKVEEPKNRLEGISIYSLLFQVIGIASIIYFIYYLGWRASATLNPNARAFSWLLLFAEAFGVFNYILFWWMTRDISPTIPHKSPRPGISVDVFVPTVNESIEILEATLTGCNLITYPHTTYVLDDGCRSEVELLAQELGCKYIPRESKKHAKAGNINHALPKTTGEFIVVLDADMVPQPEFLHRTLGYFENDNLAFIQTPQEFYNIDSIQHENKKSWHEQKLFYRVIQPGKNRSNAAFWCGSPSIVRRAALEDVGGVAVESITEDIHTSVRLHSRGWESLFVNEVLAYGIAPQTINAFLLQRLRWAQGTMQLYRSKESPIWIPGLSFKQRISYFSSFLAYFESFQRLIFILTPVIIVLFNIFPMDTDVRSFLFRWIPYFLLSLFVNQLGGRGYFNYFMTERFNMLKMFIFIQSTFTLFQSKSLKFKVTPKSIVRTVDQDERRSMRYFMMLFGLIIGVVIFGLWKTLLMGNVLGGFFNYAIALVWSSYNAFLILASLIVVLKKRHHRSEYRFPVQLQSKLVKRSSGQFVADVQIDDLSPIGARLVVDERIDFDDCEYLLRFFTPDNKYIIIPISKIHFRKKFHLGKKYLGISFGQMSRTVRTRLLEFIFITLPRISNPIITKPRGRGPYLSPLDRPAHMLEGKGKLV